MWPFPLKGIPNSDLKTSNKKHGIYLSNFIEVEIKGEKIKKREREQKKKKKKKQANEKNVITKSKYFHQRGQSFSTVASSSTAS